MEREADNYRQGTLNYFVKVGKRQMSVYERISMFENQTILLEQKEQKTECIISAETDGGRKRPLVGYTSSPAKKRKGVVPGDVKHINLQHTLHLDKPEQTQTVNKNLWNWS